jgi:hypothetical protein
LIPQRPELLQQLLNPETLKHIGTVHPALCEAAHNLAAAVHEEQAAAGRSGGSAAADKRAAGSSSGGGGSYFLDDMSDEEMEEEEQQQQQAGASRMPRHGFSITPEQVPQKRKKIQSLPSD